MFGVEPLLVIKGSLLPRHHRPVVSIIEVLNGPLHDLMPVPLLFFHKPFPRC
jgi:hypothetical protein